MMELSDIYQYWGRATRDKALFEPIMQRINDYFRPFRGDYTTRRASGQRRTTSIYDSTPAEALDTYAGFLKGLIFPSANDWLEVEPEKIDMLDDRQVRSDLAETKIRMLGAYSDSNFYQEAFQAIKSLGSVGNICLLAEEKNRKLSSKGSVYSGLQFFDVPFGRVFWFCNIQGPFMVFREIPIFLVELKKKYGDSFWSRRLREMYQQDPMQEIMICHCVYENEGYIFDAEKTSTNRAWISELILCDETVLDQKGAVRVKEQSGFDFNPYICKRYDVVDGEQYGRGICEMILGNAIGLNENARNQINASVRDTNPKLMLPDGSDLQDGEDGSMITLNSTIGSARSPEYLKSGVNYEGSELVAAKDTSQIRRALLNDAIMDPESQPRSAFESRLRNGRLMSRMATPAEPIAGMLTDAVRISTMIMLENGQLPELENYFRHTKTTRFEIRFVSPFFTAQKQAIADKMYDVVAKLTNVAISASQPEVLDTVDLDEFGSQFINYSDVNRSIFRSKDGVKLRRQVRAEQMAQQETVDLMTQLRGGSGSKARPPSGGSAPVPTTEEVAAS